MSKKKKTTDRLNNVADVCATNLLTLRHKTYKDASYLNACPECHSGIIPGLDAVTCLTCRTVFIDQIETDKFYLRKRIAMH